MLQKKHKVCWRQNISTKGVLATARLIDEKAIGIETVKIMNRVTMKNLKTEKLMTYTLVLKQADFKQGKIAVNHPLVKTDGEKSRRCGGY